ncbi:MAG: hypothetical protein QNJ46_14330 [Leptolyngbyaceae cyanobacterium MO_188.B28]|nr:hypothetical protein [Leptolyngbyaceae cyanobacterium MO_188.B28]
MNSYGRYSDQIQLDTERQKLERLFDQPKALHDRKNRLLSGLKRIRTFLLQALTTEDEPLIRIITTPTGKRWSAYDPINNRSASFDSEEGLRAWLETRYYR